MRACNGNRQCVKGLIAAGANVNTVNKNDTTALICAALNGHENCVNDLIEAGADVNTIDEDGNTALIRAAGNGIRALCEEADSSRS